jgi:MOSC domain-containing protein YiiM
MSTLAACVGHVLGVSNVPDDERAMADWLGQRGLGLVPVGDLEAFAWPGPFLARRDGEWAVLHGFPPGPVFGALSGSPQAALVIAAHEVSSAAPREATVGVVEVIALASTAEAPMRTVDAARAIAGRGLEGDRYASAAGTFSPRPGRGRDLTLVDAAALDVIGLEPVQARRNLVVRGADLDALRGRRFGIGEVECFGQRRCEPCAHLERLTRPGVLRALVHRGGLRADIVRGGELRVGDPVRAL